MDQKPLPVDNAQRQVDELLKSVRDALVREYQRRAIEAQQRLTPPPVIHPR